MFNCRGWPVTLHSWTQSGYAPGGRLAGRATSVSSGDAKAVGDVDAVRDRAGNRVARDQAVGDRSEHDAVLQPAKRAVRDLCQRRTVEDDAETDRRSDYGRVIDPDGAAAIDPDRLRIVGRAGDIISAPDDLQLDVVIQL